MIAGLLLTGTAVGGYNDGECWVSSGCRGGDYFFYKSDRDVEHRVTCGGAILRISARKARYVSAVRRHLGRISSQGTPLHLRRRY